MPEVLGVAVRNNNTGTVWNPTYPTTFHMTANNRVTKVICGSPANNAPPAGFLDARHTYTFTGGHVPNVAPPTAVNLQTYPEDSDIPDRVAFRGAGG
jgi:hypothetical protein